MPACDCKGVKGQGRANPPIRCHRIACVMCLGLPIMSRSMVPKISAYGGFEWLTTGFPGFSGDFLASTMGFKGAELRLKWAVNVN